MSETPFMPLWVSDFVGDTLDLEAKEIGAYMLLLMAMWGRDGTLPNDEKKLQRVARCGRDWPKVWAAIEHYFTVDGDTITQSRLLKELQNVARKREVNAQSGSLGGRAKALKTKHAGLANATNSLKQPEPYISTSLRSVDITDDDCARDDIDLLRDRLLEAAGDKIQPHGSLVVGPILELLNSGVDLELDVLPAIREATGRMKHPAGSWSYFTGWIQKAYARRTTAADGLGAAVEAERSRPTQQLKPRSASTQRHYAIKAELERRIYGDRNVDEFTGSTIDLESADFRTH